MSPVDEAASLFKKYVVNGNHTKSDYFSLIRELVAKRNSEQNEPWQSEINKAYSLVRDEIITNQNAPTETIKFGTSGWRGALGKDVYANSVACVTAAIVQMYEEVADRPELQPFLGITTFEEAQKRGCVVGHDNRFCGDLLLEVVVDVLSKKGFTIYFAGETTTGVLSAAVLELDCAFSINLTPSHNPLEYGGYKFNAADGGPAAPEVTSLITDLANQHVSSGFKYGYPEDGVEISTLPGLKTIESLELWKNLVRRNVAIHGLELDTIFEKFTSEKEVVAAIDSVHGASRLHIEDLFGDVTGERLMLIRNNADVTFGGIAPEPSLKNMTIVNEVLNERKESLKVGAIIDPDGDRIRFTDGTTDISMNQFGAMAYHFLVTYKGKKGMAAKTVATSNMANRLAEALGQELFEPKVGFKEFKPVIGKAIVFFEESDGISIIGHTPEKDAYIGLLLALDMVLTTGKNLGVYLKEIEDEFGAYYPDKDGIVVSVKGQQLLDKLNELSKYKEGVVLNVGGKEKKISKVITIDGQKMVLEDGSWLMIRPSGTEPKVRFYVESRTPEGTKDLVATSQGMLKEIGLVD